MIQPVGMCSSKPKDKVFSSSVVKWYDEKCELFGEYRLLDFHRMSLDFIT